MTKKDLPKEATQDDLRHAYQVSIHAWCASTRVERGVRYRAAVNALKPKAAKLVAKENASRTCGLCDHADMLHYIVHGKLPRPVEMCCQYCPVRNRWQLADDDGHTAYCMSKASVYEAWLLAPSLSQEEAQRAEQVRQNIIAAFQEDFPGESYHIPGL